MQQHSSAYSVVSTGAARRDAGVPTLHVGRQTGLFTEDFRSSADTHNMFIRVNAQD